MTARCTRSRLCHREQGAATPLAVVVVGVLTTVALAGAALGALLVGQRRAALAADLAALAGAEAAGPAVTRGVGPPCDHAATVSLRNGARLSGCSVEGLEVVVEVGVEVPLLMGISVTVPGVARAGPSGSVPLTGSQARYWGGPAP